MTISKTRKPQRQPWKGLPWRASSRLCDTTGKRGNSLSALQPVCPWNHSADSGLSGEHCAGCWRDRDKRQTAPSWRGRWSAQNEDYLPVYIWGKAKHSEVPSSAAAAFTNLHLLDGLPLKTQHGVKKWPVQHSVAIQQPNRDQEPHLLASWARSFMSRLPFPYLLSHLMGINLLKEPRRKKTGIPSSHPPSHVQFGV